MLKSSYWNLDGPKVTVYNETVEKNLWVCKYYVSGKGLGKNEDGISEALKPKLKFDNTGVGHNSSEQFTFNWWENVFNNAADNLNVSLFTCNDPFNPK